ncbi:hypothetical protein GXN76_13955 [Kroppenstedtia pulmonis]|uniref:Uncharacterized protein n=1 Tax=Kroppenstedtia pulmonis TaxID=1380685 RepID=A0A7D3XR96_9BACL|nr:hypothetical protein [Kroppenstedtia pulmonis]QKG85447.1 hypothetical protein GXN76_13955 [Kroppenstedtia pulmonis]
MSLDKEFNELEELKAWEEELKKQKPSVFNVKELFKQVWRKDAEDLS